MHIPFSQIRKVISPILFAIVLASCGQPAEVDVPITQIVPTSLTATELVPTELPPPPKTLVVCLGQEPSSLYLYSPSLPETDAILQAIYDGPIDLRGYQYQPVILSRLPTLDDGDARIEIVELTEGDVYLNPQTQEPDVLSTGKIFFPVNCSSSDCQSEFEGGTVTMGQMLVDFELMPGILWSDGEPMTVHDSIFSYSLDAHADTPSTKYLVHRTSSYESIDDHHVRWVGIPGFLDPDYQSNFWSPLPMHLLQDFTPLELLTADESTRFPVGWGAYVIDSWEPGVEIVMRQSENYFRQGEGLPHFDLLRLRFLGSDTVSALEQVLTRECDVLDESIISNSLLGKALDYAAGGRLNLISTSSAIMQRIDFNLGADESPTTFSDPRLRRAFAACIDRQEIVDQALWGLSEVPDTIIPPGHPFHLNQDLVLPSLDQAMGLLDDAGWVDDDGDPGTPRIASGVPGIANGTTLEVRFFAANDYFSEIITPMIGEAVSRCGFSLVPEIGEAGELFEPWPNGPIFGGRFDLVSWSWPTFTSPSCEMFAGFEIPSSDHVYGVNASGFRNSEYDRACLTILSTATSGEGYPAALQTMTTTLQEELPSLPLYLQPRVLLQGTGICGASPDPSTFSTLWNIEEFAAGDSCIP